MVLVSDLSTQVDSVLGEFRQSVQLVRVVESQKSQVMLFKFPDTYQAE